MPSCCAVGCANRSTSNLELTFYRIPGGAHPFQQNRRRLWLRAISRDKWSETEIKNARLCSAHFISGKTQVQSSPVPVNNVFINLPWQSSKFECFLVELSVAHNFTCTHTYTFYDQQFVKRQSLNGVRQSWLRSQCVQAHRESIIINHNKND